MKQKNPTKHWTRAIIGVNETFLDYARIQEGILREIEEKLTEIEALKKCYAKNETTIEKSALTEYGQEKIDDANMCTDWYEDYLTTIKTQHYDKSIF